MYGYDSEIKGMGMDERAVFKAERDSSGQDTKNVLLVLFDIFRVLDHEIIHRFRLLILSTSVTS